MDAQKQDSPKSFRFLAIGPSRIPGANHNGRSKPDVTERRKADRKATYMARHDALTSLPNRHLLAERMQLAMAQAKRGDRIASKEYGCTFARGNLFHRPQSANAVSAILCGEIADRRSEG